AEDGRPLDRALVPTTGSVPEPTSTTVVPSSSTTAASPVTTAPPPPPPPTAAPRPHAVVPQPWVAFAAVGPVVLHHPSDHTEAIGFHQSGHDGAQPFQAAPSAVRWFTMEDRGRDTHLQGAADVVVEPDRALRVPVTGRVIRGGQYTLYCDHVDEYAVIEPEARPGWEVKVLHVEGLAIAPGQRVEAGVTPLAARARVLPFPSQVEESTGEPPWPHVHLEVVDPSVPDRPTGGGCP
ncbi:MAG: hypothetical protein ACO1PW_08060, partial [Actinomycetota bacterium]